MRPKLYLAWYENRNILSLVEAIDYENDVATISYIDERTEEEKYIEVAIEDLEWFEEAKTSDIYGEPIFEGTIVASETLPGNGGVIISGEIPFTNEEGNDRHYEGFALLTSSDLTSPDPEKHNDIILPLSHELVEQYEIQTATHVKMMDMWEE